MVVTGYGSVDGEHALVLEPDWIDPASPVSLGNEDLVAGTEIELVVDRMVETRFGAFRALRRADGGGRFLVGEASRSQRMRDERGEVAVALDPNDSTMLERLRRGAGITGTVIPTLGRANRVSILPFLTRHLAAAATEHHKPDARSTTRVPYWRASIIQPPNASGWGQAELDHRDDASGVSHRFGIKEDLLIASGIQTAEGTELLVQLAAGSGDSQDLRIDGLESELSDVLDAVSSSVRFGERRDRERNLRPGTWLWVTRPPVPGTLVEGLLRLANSSARRKEVYEFVTSALYRRVASVRSLDDHADLEPRPLAQTADDLRASFPIGAHIRAQVSSIKDELSRAWFKVEGGIEGSASGTDIGYPTGVIRPSLWIHTGQELDAEIVGISDRQPRPPQLTLRIALQVPDRVAQLTQLGISVGAICSGTVGNTKEGLGVFVDLLPGVQGMLHVSRLGGTAPSAFRRGQEVTVRVRSIRNSELAPLRIDLEF